MSGNGSGGEVSKYVSKDPARRAAQLGNLRPQSAIKHGAYSAEHLRPERERVLRELLTSFPGVRRDRLEIAAEQRARITLLQRFVDARGIIRHRGRGETFPVVGALQREEISYRAELAKIEDLAREAATPNPQQALAAIVAAADGNEGDA